MTRALQLQAAKAAVRASMITLLYEVSMIEDQSPFDTLVITAEFDDDHCEIGYVITLDDMPLAGSSL
ncbi:hypothetical protein [Polaromonas aquatica]|uniref:hypothetical protein n=1 Tax=Polaromonas aquatica TaxID=332657 RepID=UPI003D6515E2